MIVNAAADQLVGAALQRMGGKLSIPLLDGIGLQVQQERQF